MPYEPELAEKIAKVRRAITNLTEAHAEHCAVPSYVLCLLAIDLVETLDPTFTRDIDNPFTQTNPKEG